MNQEIIGRFIAENRKAKKLTQEGLVEKPGITNKSISKWEMVIVCQIHHYLNHYAKYWTFQ